MATYTYMYIGNWMDNYEYRRTGSTSPVPRWIERVLRDEDTSKCAQHGRTFFQKYGPGDKLSPEAMELAQAIAGVWTDEM